MAHSRVQYEELVKYQQARIKALEDRVKTLEYLRNAALNDVELFSQAQQDTMDFINSKLFSNG
jgi:outer membrane PBP1 activator LpoA protein